MVNGLQTVGHNGLQFKWVTNLDPLPALVWRTH